MEKAKKKEIDMAMQQAVRLLETRQFDECMTLVDSLAKELKPADGQDVLLAKLLYRLDEHNRSIAFYLRALDMDPDNVAVLTDLATVYIATQQYSHAGAVLEKALSLNPESVPAMSGMGALMLFVGDHIKAIDWLERAVKCKTLDANVYSNLSLALGLEGRNDESLSYADQARRRDPKNPIILCSLARTLIALGRMGEAQRFLYKAIELDPLYGPAYERLTMAKKFTQLDLEFIEKSESQLQHGMRVSDRYGLQYAIGKMYDDIGQYEKAFHYFRQANTLSRPLMMPPVDSHLVDMQKKILTPENIKKSRLSGNPSRIPVFIIGMPRSGTSLMEQIIDSHPCAAGAGELSEMPLVAGDLYAVSRQRARWGRVEYSMPDPAFWSSKSSEYLSVLCSGREEALRVVDKLPDNYRFIGVAALMFPDARIIHAVRHPLDVCLSCYFQQFIGLKWSNDFSWIVETYKQYRRLVEQWKVLLPDRIVDVCYESLIDNPEQESRRLIDACGLDWDPVCLEYAYSGRAVQTASAWQVRQPIYKTSKMRWVNYAPYIGELAQGIVDYLDDNDIEILAQHGVKIRRKRWLSR